MADKETDGIPGFPLIEKRGLMRALNCGGRIIIYFKYVTKRPMPLSVNDTREDLQLKIEIVKTCSNCNINRKPLKLKTIVKVYLGYTHSTHSTLKPSCHKRD